MYGMPVFNNRLGYGIATSSRRKLACSGCQPVYDPTRPLGAGVVEPITSDEARAAVDVPSNFMKSSLAAVWYFTRKRDAKMMDVYKVSANGRKTLTTLQTVLNKAFPKGLVDPFAPTKAPKLIEPLTVDGRFGADTLKMFYAYMATVWPVIVKEFNPDRPDVIENAQEIISNIRENVVKWLASKGELPHDLMLFAIMAAYHWRRWENLYEKPELSQITYTKSKPANLFDVPSEDLVMLPTTKLVGWSEALIPPFIGTDMLPEVTPTYLAMDHNGNAYKVQSQAPFSSFSGRTGSGSGGVLPLVAFALLGYAATQLLD